MAHVQQFNLVSSNRFIVLPLGKLVELTHTSTELIATLEQPSLIGQLIHQWLVGQHISESEFELIVIDLVGELCGVEL